MALNNGIRYKLNKGINEAISGQWTIYKSENSTLNILEAQLKEQSKFKWDDNDSKQILEISPDLSLNKRIRFGSLISFNDETSWVNIQALEEEHLQRLNLLLRLDKGTMPRKNGIMISPTMADELHCSVGDTVLLVAENTNDYMSDEIAVVSGIFLETGLATFFGYNAFIPYEMGKSIVQLDNGECVELVVNSISNTKIESQTVGMIQKYLSAMPDKPLIIAWDKTIPLFYSVAQVWKSSGLIIQFIFIAFSLVILVSLISLIIFSRKREFGTLLAIGFSWTKISLMVCAEYLIICCSSVVIGFVLTAVAISFIPQTGIFIASKDMQSALMTDYLLPQLYPENFIYVWVLFSITTIISVLISIARIKKMSPIQLIHK